MWDDPMPETAGGIYARRSKWRQQNETLFRSTEDTVKKDEGSSSSNGAPSILANGMNRLSYLLRNCVDSEPDT
ncbi:hypothetical protein Tco_0980419 [Tanacetum coccineum]